MFSDTYQGRNLSSVVPYHFGLISGETFATLFECHLTFLLLITGRVKPMVHKTQ